MLGARARAALGLLRGGLDARGGRRARSRRSGARVVHAHNLQPALGWRALAAARAAGARVVLHLHQYRLVCAVGVCFTRGAECTRCHGRNTLPGRAPELPRQPRRGRRLRRVARAVAAAHGRRRPTPFVVPSAFARERLRALGAPLPWDRVHVLAPPVRALARQDAPEPTAAGAGARERARPRSGRAGAYALVVSRLAPEKGVDVAIEACRAAGMPLVIAGDGPERAALKRARGARQRERGASAWRCGPSPGTSTRPSWRGCAPARRSRSSRRARPRRSAWRPPRRWPRACRSSPAASARCRELVERGRARAAGRRRRAGRGRSGGWRATAPRASAAASAFARCARRESSPTALARVYEQRTSWRPVPSWRMPDGRALITGLTGQDGSFLAELLLEKGYEVTGSARGRRASLGCAEHLREQVELVDGELLEPATLRAADRARAAERDLPPGGALVRARLLGAPRRDAARDRRRDRGGARGGARARPGDARVFVAASGAIFGERARARRTSDTPCRPTTPYAIAKLAAHQLVGALREHDGLHASSGIVFNHESERRPERFVTRRITRARRGDRARPAAAS